MSGNSSLPIDVTRITRRADFLRANQGRKQVTSGVILRVIPSPSPSMTACRVGFTVSKTCGNAVTRNRIKRRLRALVGELWPHHARAGFDYVLIGRAGAEKIIYEKLRQELVMALRRLYG
jgi:ribonuclease P protein component